MAIKKCKGCGSIFDGITPYCSRCMQEIDYRYKNVRDYLYENPDETVDQVSEATGTPKWMIVYYLRDGRLNVKDASGYIRCEQCGKPLTTGRYCPDCMVKIEKKMQGATIKRKDNKGEEGPKMHTW